MSAAAAAPAPALRKATTTAIAILPPPAIRDRIDAVRRNHDRHCPRWMPHITLLFPWVPIDDPVAVRAAVAGAVAAGPGPFMVSLSGRPNVFGHRRGCTVWLPPTAPGNALARLQAALLARFPHCDDVLHNGTFTPHLTLGQAPSRAVARERVAEWEALFGDLPAFEVSEVALLTRSGDSNFRVADTVPLPTVPAAQPAPSSAPVPAHRRGRRPVPISALSSTPGIGVQPSELGDTCWNFAYGSNMSRAKVAKRGLSPLTSVRATLADYRLEFNHRGAMGNVEPTPGGTMHGILHRLTRAEMLKLWTTEEQYDAVPVTCTVYNDDLAKLASDDPDVVGPNRSTVRALVFRSKAHRRIVDGLQPTRRYIAFLRDGAREWGLAQSYVAFLDAFRPIPDKARGDPYWTLVGPAPAAPAHASAPAADAVDSLTQQTEQLSLATHEGKRAPDLALIARQIEQAQPRPFLVVLDLNGTLFDRSQKQNIRAFRPQLEGFLAFLFANVHVAVWSSAMDRNVTPLVSRVFGSLPLAFQLHRSACVKDTSEGAGRYDTLKDLDVVWRDNALSRGAAFNPTNTLLLDDSATKGARHPRNMIVLPEFVARDYAIDNTFAVLIPLLQTMLQESTDVREWLAARKLPEPLAKHPLA